MDLMGDAVCLESFLGAVFLGQLSRPEDPPGFFRLLQSALVLCPKDGATPPSGMSFAQVESHRDAVQGVLSSLLRAKKRNMLAAGVSQNGGGGGGFLVSWPNAALKVVRTMTWELLHARVGTELFRFLLRETQIFVSLEGDGGYLQVCGPPLTAPKRPEKKVPSVERWRILYNDRFLKRAGFEGMHILSDGDCRPTEKFAARLCRMIFACEDGSRLHMRYRAVRPLLVRLVKKHFEVRYGLLLQILCPLSATHTEQGDVVKFVWACLTKLIPSGLWGCCENRKLARRMVDQFVRLRRFEEFDLSPWVDGWRLSHCEWIPKTRTPTQHAIHKAMARQWLAWVMNSLVVPLIRNHFYVTESAAHGTRLFYFRKPTWRQMVARSGVIEKLELGPAHPVQPRGSPSSLRLIPKSTLGSLRVVARVRQNDRVRPVLDALRWELFENGKSHLLGASVFGFHDVFNRLAEFKHRVGSQQQWYFVKVDVKSAFDTVRQDKLCRVLVEGGLFSAELYCIQHFYVNGRLRSRAVPPAHWETPGGGRERGVVADCAWGEWISRAELEARLFEHIRVNLVTFRGQVYRQQMGISQGSVLSSLLCSLYYGHLERHLLGDLLALEDSLLMRWIDDTLFVTPSKEAAVAVMQRLIGNGVRFEYGVQVELNKSSTNFRDDCLPAGIGCRNDGRFAWCGLLIDTTTLEITWDYARYAGSYLNDSLTAPLWTNGSLQGKLRLFVRAKCLAVLMSRRINGADTIVLNVYQMFLYVAAKFVCLARSLHGQRRRHSERFLFVHVIQGTIEFASTLVHGVSSNHVRFLGLHAFRTILIRRPSEFPLLVDHLNVALSRSTATRSARALVDIVDPSQSSVFHDLLF